MGKVEQVKGSGPRGGREIFNGGRVDVDFETMIAFERSASPQKIKTELLHKIRTSRSPVRAVVKILSERYAVHASIELSPEEVQSKRIDELTNANEACNRKLSSLASFSDGYVFNDVMGTIRAVRELENTFQSETDEPHPLGATSDTLRQILDLSAHYDCLVPDDSSTGKRATLEDLAALWSTKSKAR